MAKTQKLSHMRKKKGKLKDPCPVCEEELFLNQDYSKRGGLLADDGECIGWMCPYCYSEFDFTNRVTYIMPMDNGRGIA